MHKTYEAIHSPPNTREIRCRYLSIQKQMKHLDLDYYIVFNPVNVYYLTNFANKVNERPFILLVPQDGNPFMLVPMLEKSHVERRTLLELSIIEYPEFPAPTGKNWHDHYKNHLPPNLNIGIESSLPIEIFNHTPGNKVICDLVDDLRIIKTDYEISRNIHACGIINRAHKELLKRSRAGLSLSELIPIVNSMITKEIYTHIAEANMIVTKSSVGVWPPSISHDPPLIPKLTTKLVNGGPHVTILTAQIDGYGVEIERTFFINFIPEKARKPFDVMFKARALAFALCKPGVNLGEIDRKVKNLIKENGFGEFILHRTGHGIGITGHEAPYLADGYDRSLEPGMLVSIEPGIYIPGLGGFRHSDTVLITPDGNLSLTHAPDKLEDLILER